MKIVPALVLGAVALPLAAAPAGRPAMSAKPKVAAIRSPSHTGTIVAAHQDGRQTVLVVRDGGGQLVHIAVGRSSRILSSDRRAVDRSSVRIGDRLEVRANGQIEDLSQRTADLFGLVSLGRDPSSGSIVVAVRHGQSIVVDMGRQTRYSDRSRETTSPSEIEDGDLVRLHGTLDNVLGEMTQTDAILRLGPVLQKGHQTGQNQG